MSTPDRQANLVFCDECHAAMIPPYNHKQWCSTITDRHRVQIFEMWRDLADGPTVVALGAIFPDGTTVTRWVSGTIRQTCVWRYIEDVIEVHGHDGATRFVYDP